MVLGLLAHVTPSIFFSKILRSEALAYNSYFFFRTAVLRKLFDIRFSYKHCNFSRVCLLVNMAPKICSLTAIKGNCSAKAKLFTCFLFISRSETTQLPPEIFLNVLKLLPRIFCRAKINQVDKSRLLQTSNVWSCNRRYLSYLQSRFDSGKIRTAAVNRDDQKKPSTYSMGTWNWTVLSGSSLPGLTIFMYQLQRNIRACNVGFFTTCRYAILNGIFMRDLGSI